MLFNPPDHPSFETFDLEGRIELLQSFNMQQTLDPIDRVSKYAHTADDPGGEPPVFSDEEYLVLSSNNFLGLATDDRVQKAAKDAIDEIGTGSGASRVGPGDTPAHRALEREIAATKHTDRALVYSSGYATNLGVITALYPNVIFSDERNHTCLIEAAKMTDAKIVEYDHCNPNDLKTKLEAYAESDPQNKWLIATDSVFSMDGTIAPLDDICTLADEHDAWVMADEAHATGVYGDEGGGIVGRMGLHDQVDIQMGTLSKALASQGGYIAGDESLIKYLQTSSRTFLFSAGLNPAAAAAARKALEIARESDLSEQLLENAAYLRKEIEAAGFETWGEAHIVPVIIGDPGTTTEFAQQMKERGILVHDVPYPAVEHGTDRLRLIPSAEHTQQELDRTVNELADIGSTLGIIE